MAIAPRISISGGRAAYVGPALALAPHRNAVATVAIALDTAFDLTVHGETHHRRIALIAPDTQHHLVASGDMAFVYLDALSDDYRWLASTDLDAAAERVRSCARSADVDALCAALDVPKRAAPDARIAAVIRRIDASPQAFERVADAAALAQLSPSRFQALFRRGAGMAFRRYRTWMRMAHVVRSLSHRRSLTSAGLEAGFSSSAHLSADFRKMFGLSPSHLAALNAHLSVSAEQGPI